MSQEESGGTPSAAIGGRPGRAGRVRRAVLVVLVLAGMVFAAAVGMFLSLLFAIRGKEVVVPNLLEMTKEQAETTARASRLTMEVGPERPDARIGAGRVLEQDPSAGRRVRPGRRIRVAMSLGQQTIEVPSLVGGPARKAQLTLRQLGLRVGSIAHAPSFDHLADEVVAQRPAPGALRQKGEPVDLLISRGAPPRTYVMPALEGLPVDRATETLKDGGVRASIARREARRGVAPGLVLEQQPPEGHPIRETETVRLVVSQ